MMENSSFAFLTDDDQSVDANNISTLGLNLGKCSNDLPSILEYYQGIDATVSVIVIATLILCIGTFLIFIRNVRNIIVNVPKKFKTKSILLCQIYPIVTGASLISAIIPKSYFLADSVSHVTFVFCAYIFFSLCLDYADGEDNFIKLTDSQTFNIKTPPCCCCLPCLTPSNVTKSKIRNVRLLLIQLVVIQPLIFIALNIIYIEDVNFFNDIIFFFIPFILTSILFGVWGLNIIVRMVAPFFSDYKLMGKYFALQAVLLLCRIQPFVIQAIVTGIAQSCQFPLTLQVQKNAVFQLCLTTEMFFLSLWAMQLYKIPSRKSNSSITL